MKKIFLWAVSILLAILVVLILVGNILANTPEGKAKKKDRNAISYCKSEQSKADDSNEFIFLALACKELEKRFVKRWNQQP
jgi:hypothetical protein